MKGLLTVAVISLLLYRLLLETVLFGCVVLSLLDSDEKKVLVGVSMLTESLDGELNELQVLED